ncbi:MAG: arsenate reductase family protein [Wolinella sp.]
MKLYGIKNCGSVKKAVGFLNERGIAFEFIDLKQTKVQQSDILCWIKACGIDKLLNTKGTTYKNLKLKDLSLDDSAKIEWLERENMLLKRPIIEIENGKILVGFDINEYESIFK